MLGGTIIVGLNKPERINNSQAYKLFGAPLVVDCFIVESMIGSLTRYGVLNQFTEMLQLCQQTLYNTVYSFDCLETVDNCSDSGNGKVGTTNTHRELTFRA